ncbi:hypothetical protein GOV05_01585 [Candidatus Woesearchaeota archaeon]|nr:hypothetical protein [Candidatus Woesearchaeota archaeon]
MGGVLVDLGYCKVIREKPVTKDVLDAVEEAYNKNKALFSKEPKKKFKIIICDSLSEFKKRSGKHFKPWVTARVDKMRILIKSQELIKKAKKPYDKLRFKEIMVHEVNHVFWNSFFGLKNKPAWLQEGLASYVSGSPRINNKELREAINKYKVSYKILDYRYMNKKIKGHMPKYYVWEGFTRYLVERHGAKKIVRFMDEYSKHPYQDDYKALFSKYFKKSDGRVFRDYLNRLFNKEVQTYMGKY